MTDFDRVFGVLRSAGILLLADTRIASVASLVAGEPVRGSWWGHKSGRAIYAVASRLTDHADVAVTRLVAGKVTFVHRKLWPALAAVARSREAWQTASLPRASRCILEEVERRGELRTDELENPSPAAVRVLERRLLVASRDVHTERGSHAKVLESWSRWSRRSRPRRRVDAARAKRALEGALVAAGGEPRRAVLPWLVSLLVVLAWAASGGAIEQPSPPRTLVSKQLAAPRDGAELEVRLRARAPGASWREEERECAALEVLIDGRYDQHLFVLGPDERPYAFLVGPLGAGEHRLEIVWDRSWAPRLDEAPVVGAIETRPIDPSDPSSEPLRRAPILHLRPDTIGRASDLPLLCYWEREREGRVAYSILFSNEDGGTSTARLLARWGRTTDIEWCYAYRRRGAELVEEFQGRDHATLPFRGAKQGAHPILYDATPNNVFADAADAPLRVRVRPVPIEISLAGRAREVVMDRFPWTYTIASDEMQREQKIGDPPHRSPEIVSDLGNYAYVELCAEQRGTELFFELELASGRKASSDGGDPRARIARSGCFRSAIELPAGTRREDVARLRVECRPAPTAEGQRPVPSPRADLRSLERLFLLDEHYRPGSDLAKRRLGRQLRPGEALVIPIARDGELTVEGRSSR